jgi:lysophospholipase L1-like esterase
MNINNKKILFIGDSITDCGRSYPIGYGESLGNGYVSLINSMLCASYPNLNFEILNTGISGNRITDLDERWDRDVTAHNPNWLCIKIGINDVWRHFDMMLSDDQVSVSLYEQTYRKLIETTIDKVEKIIIISPYYIEPDKNDSMRKMMDDYRKAAKKLAAEYKLTYIDTQNAFDRYLAFKSYDTLAEDKVHPNQIGHMIIAKEFLRIIEQ